MSVQTRVASQDLTDIQHPTVNTLGFFADGNDPWAANFERADLTGGILISAGTYLIERDITLASHVSAQRGVLLVGPAAGATVTINGIFDAGLFPVFGSGITVRFGSLRHVFPEWWGAVASGADQTSHVQAALDSLAADLGGYCEVSRGIKFSLDAVAFPKRSNLRFFADDNLGTSGAGLVSATNELTEHAANANAAGIVNERRVSAAFHPAHIVDVRKSVAGHDAFLGPGQSRLAPARASFNIFDDGLIAWRTVYQNYCNAFSYFSGIYTEARLNRYTLQGITAGSFVTVPAVGEKITGNTSGAVGYLISIDGAEAIVAWISGKFIVGETVSDADEISGTAITVATYSNLEGQPLTTDLMSGTWAIGLPPGRALETFNVGGKILTAPTRNFGQYLPEVIVDPGFVWVDGVEGAPNNGFEIIYDKSTAAAANRRLYLTKLNSSDRIGHVGAVRAHTSFNNAVAKAASSFNIDTIVRNGVGDYTINFLVPFTRADYAVALTTSTPLEFGVVFAKTVGALRVRVYTTGTANLVDLTAVLNVVCVGGDI